MTILHANTVNKTSFQEVLLQGSIPCEKIWCVKVLTSLDHKALCYIKRIIKRGSFHIFKLFKKPEILKGTSKNMIQLSNLVENHVYFPFYFLNRKFNVEPELSWTKNYWSCIIYSISNAQLLSLLREHPVIECKATDHANNN